MARIGIIGRGKVVEDAHLPVLKTLPGGEVQWVLDASEARSRLLSRMYRVRSYHHRVGDLGVDHLERHLRAADDREDSSARNE